VGVDGLDLQVAHAPRGALRDHADDAFSVLLPVVPKTVCVNTLVAFFAHDREGGILLLRWPPHPRLQRGLDACDALKRSPQGIADLVVGHPHPLAPG
jgi:hypothetical protein